MLPSSRFIAFWIPQWPVRCVLESLGNPPYLHEGLAAVVQRRGKIIALTPPAGAAGIREGDSVRSARLRLGELQVLGESTQQERAEFERILRSADELVSAAEAYRPGLAVLPAAGPARYYGSEQEVINALSQHLGEQTGYQPRFGAADSALGAFLAAREQQIVPSGQIRQYLAPLPLTLLTWVPHFAEQGSQTTDFLSLLFRLGITTFGGFADLPKSAVADRFGQFGLHVWQLSTGQSPDPTLLRRPEQDLSVHLEFDPPLTQVAQLAFVAKQLAEQLSGELAKRGCSYQQLVVAARFGQPTEAVDLPADAELQSTSDGTPQWRREFEKTDQWAERTWYTGGELPISEVVNRVRWQAEGWLQQSSGPIAELSLYAEQVFPATGTQDRLWGQPSGSQRRAASARQRVGGIVGGHGVLHAVETGGYHPRQRLQLRGLDYQEAPAKTENAPWPGQLPDPQPTLLAAQELPAPVWDDQHQPITITERLALSGTPTWVSDPQQSDRHLPIVSWAGPWPIVTDWFSDDQQRRAYFQVLVGDGQGLLLYYRAGQWWWEGSYD